MEIFCYLWTWISFVVSSPLFSVFFSFTLFNSNSSHKSILQLVLNVISLCNLCFLFFSRFEYLIVLYHVYVCVYFCECVCVCMLIFVSFLIAISWIRSWASVAWQTTRTGSCTPWWPWSIGKESGKLKREKERNYKYWNHMKSKLNYLILKLNNVKIQNEIPVPRSLIINIQMLINRRNWDRFWNYFIPNFFDELTNEKSATLWDHFGPIKCKFFSL